MKPIRAWLCSFLFCSIILPASAADFGAWSRMQAITFPGYDKTETLTNFPVLVTLGAHLAGFSYADFASPTDGADLRFAADNQVDELNFEIEKWDTNGVSFVWVQVPRLAGPDTRILALWGNPAAAAPACQTNGAAWSNNFVAVWHLGEATATCRDSTVNRNDGTKNGNTAAAPTGSIAAAQSFDGSGDFVDCGTGVSLDFPLPRTISAWVKPVTLKTNAGVLGKDNNRASPYSYITSVSTGTLSAYDNTAWRNSATGVATGLWQHVAYETRGDGLVRFYVNGQAAGTSTWAHIDTGTHRVYIGSWVNQAAYDFHGQIDEVTLSRAARGSNWIWASWANQATGSTFAAYGTAQNTLLVQSLPATAVRVTQATLNGILSADAEEPGTEVAFCWGYTNAGTGATGDWPNVISLGAGWIKGDSFSNTLAGLLSGSTYVYRCYATNAAGAVWSAPQTFTTIYLPAVTNTGALPVNHPYGAVLRGAVTDTGLDTPSVWFYWWPVGGATSVVPMGAQAGSFSNTISGLTPLATYEYAILASNLAGAAWSTVSSLEMPLQVATFTGVSSGRWELASNWDLGRVPTVTDDVVIPTNKIVRLDATASAASILVSRYATLSVAGTNASVHWRSPLDTNRTEGVGLTVAGDLTLNGGSLAIGGLNQLCPSFLTVGGNLVLTNIASATNASVLAIYAGYAGATNVVATYSNGGARVTVAGATVLAYNSNASYPAAIYPYCNQISGAPVLFDLQDLAIASNAQFNATGRGHSLVGATYYGPGVAALAYGGSYGGKGGGTTPREPYGYTQAPFRPGSPGRASTQTASGMGGGALRILARAVRLEGKLIADGVNHSGSGASAGSGGSVWVTCSNFTAVGTAALISAKGGNGVGYGSTCAGGGGRIAILTDNPTAAQLDSLYNTGTAAGLIVTTTNMADPVTSPYPSLASAAGGYNDTVTYYPDSVYHGKPGTAVWLRNKGDQHQVVVWGSPSPTATVAVATSPAYGTDKQPAGEALFTARSPGFVPNSGEQSRLFCTGYAWSNAPGATGAGAETNVTIDITADTWLTWSWGGLEHRLTVRSGGNGTVVSDYAEWYTNGSALTLTAQPAGGCTFLYWLGDVAYADRANASLAVTMERPRSLVACFANATPRSLTANPGAAGGDWLSPATWDGTATPGPADSVTLTNGDIRVLLPAEITIAQLTLSSNAFLHVGGTGASELAQTPITTDGTKPVGLTVTGSVRLENAAKLTLGGLNSEYPAYLTVGGNLLATNTAALAVYAGYAGATNVLATYSNGGARVTVGGTTTLARTSAWIYPFCHQVSGAPVVFDLKDLLIATNTGFNATGRGHGVFSAIGPAPYLYYGPGAPTAVGSGGSYGGKGGGTAREPYGFSFAPFRPGSPGRNYKAAFCMGGGAVRILARTVYLEGKLLADGLDNSGADNGAGSGGSIWVTCASFTAAGTAAVLSVRGGNATQHGTSGAGGGGRIAVMTNSPTAAQLDELFNTGTATNLIVVTTNMMDVVTSPYPTLANVSRGVNVENISNPTYVKHGQPGTAVWLSRQQAGSFQVSVAGDPLPLGVVTPDYGTAPQPPDPLLFSAVSPVFVPGSASQSRLSCTGYTWSNASESVSGAGTSVTVTITADTWLTWSWSNLEHRLWARTGGKGSLVQDYTEWYTNGSTCTLTAVPDAGCAFVHWVGDIPFADRLNTQITLTLDRPRAVVACFTEPAGGARDLAWAGGASADWFDTNQWDGVAIPGVYDRVVLTNGAASIPWPGDFTLASLALSNSAKLFIGGAGAAATALVPADAGNTNAYRLLVTAGLTLSDNSQLAVGGLNPTSLQALAVGGDLRLAGSATLAVYAGYSGETPDWQAGGARVTVGGATELTGSNNWVYPFCHQMSGAPVVFALQNLAIATNCGFDANYRGFGRMPRYTPALVHDYYGPGRGTNGVGQWGGSYGGRGGENGTLSCGFTNAPFLPGSPGRDPNLDAFTLGGGGAIRILAQEVQLDGKLTANGFGRYPAGGGSGGGIWVTCTHFALGASGRLIADGGPANFYGGCGGGGGGRIAVGEKLPQRVIDHLYNSGEAAGITVESMADLPDFAANHSVTGGLSAAPYLMHGGLGTAVFIAGPPTGTVIILY